MQDAQNEGTNQSVLYDSVDEMTPEQRAYYYSLSPRDALAYDIKNVREIYQSQGLYSQIRPQLQQYIKEYKNLMPEGESIFR